MSQTSVLDVLRHHMERKTGFEPATLTLARCLSSSATSWESSELASRLRNVH